MRNSYFDGSLLQLVGYRILGGLLTTLTFGIAAPWAIVMVVNWKVKHTVIDGHRLYFDGSAINLFGQWIKWLLLTFITFGIYGFWLSIKTTKWITKHTHMIN